MKTLFEIPTRGDTMTQPGGIALRAREDGSEFVVHYYNTDRETGTERHYFQGSYFGSGLREQSLVKALAEVHRRAERQSFYDLGGSIDLEKLLGLPTPLPA